MKNIQFFRKLLKFWGDFQKLLTDCNFRHGFAFVIVPSISSLESDEQLRSQIVQLIGEGYQVTIVSKQKQTKCEQCCALKAFYEGKLSRTVLRGGGGSNAADLLDM